ncbi:MAG: MFS transporter [Myxococcales bacterium]|nr:MFS transporter [Myxococcales bacterium]
MNAPVGYLELLKKRPGYRAIWLASAISLTGDWFTLIALYSLLQAYTGRSEAIGLMLLARFVPPGIFSPLAGVVADRLHRKKVMIACDVLRALVVLGFLLVRDASGVWLVYALTFAQLTLGAFFDPAEQAAIGSVVEPHEVVTATTLQGATWSAMLGFGALAGGVVTAALGRDASFVVDACSYLLSAFFVSRAAIPKVQHPPRARSWAATLGLLDLLEGWKLVASRPRLRRTLWVKSGWAIPGGAAILLYAVFGERLFTVAGSPDVAMGVLLGMRGAGAFVGPLLARRLGGDSVAWLERAIGVAFLVTAVFWLLFAQAPWLFLAAALLALAHTGVSTQWVFSSSLITLQVEDRLRGRVFAVDFMAYTLVLGASSWLGGRLLDHHGFAPRELMSWLAGVLLLSAAVWWALAPKREA